jgi:HEAT repeat protein
MGLSGATWAAWGGAAALALVGVVLLAWAIRGDPSRGRRRCPKCWYSMEGVAGLRCPECGKTAADERRLFKTRRGRRAGVIASLLALLAAGLWFGERVERLKWRAAPMAVRILVIPWVDLNDADFREAMNEVVIGPLPRWEQALVRSRLRAAMRSSSAATRAMAVQYLRAFDEHACDTTALLDDVRKLMDDPDPNTAYVALNAVAFMQWHDPSLGTTWLRLLRDSPNGDVRASAAALLGWIEVDGQGEALLAALDDPDPQVVSQAVYSLCRLHVPGAAAKMLPLLKPDSGGVYSTVAYQIGKLGPEARPAVPILVEMLRAGDFEGKIVAATGLGRMGATARPAVHDLVRALSTEEDAIKLRAVRSLGLVAEAGDKEAIAALLELLRSGSTPKVINAVISLARLGWTPEGNDRAVVEDVAESKDAGGAAVWARVMLARADGRQEQLIDDLITQLGSKDHWDMEAAADALGWIGPPARRAIPPLERYAEPLTANHTIEEDIMWQAATRNLELLRP